MFNLRTAGLAIVASALCVGPHSLHAAEKTWNVSSGTEFWANGTNWQGGSSAGASDIAVFSAANGNQVIRSKNASVGGLIFNNTGTTSIAGGLTSTNGDGDFTIGSGGITVNAGAGAVSLGLNSSNHRIVTLHLSANQSWINNSSSLLSRQGNATRVGINLASRTLTVGGSGDTSFYHDIQGTGSIVKEGTGTLTIDSNTAGTAAPIASYTGATTVNAGTMVLVTNANINSTASLSVAEGATFTNNSTVAFTKSIALSEGATLNGTGSFTPTSLTISADLGDNAFAAIELGTASLTKAGNFELTLSGLSYGTYTLFSGGTLLSAFDTMTIGGVELTSTGLGDFSGVIGGTEYSFTNLTNQLTVIPEPSTIALLGVGITAFAAFRRRRNVTVRHQ